MDSSLEIRKLSPSIIREFVTILEYAESWKRIMSIIPKTLEKENYACDIGVNNLPKYNSEHFRLIENAATKFKKSCTEILFDEWGTSGRVRPTLGHLLHLLVKAELFRAADYVAVVLLKQKAPARPKNGPAALITIDLHEDDEVEKILDEIDYPSSAIQNIINSYNTNIDYSKEMAKSLVIPEIVISELPDVKEDKQSFNVPMVVPREKDDTNSSNCSSKTENNERTSDVDNNEISDMIKFSKPNINQEQDLPNLSVFNNTVSSSNLPSFNELLKDQNISSTKSSLSESEIISEVEGNIPQLSQLLNSSNVEKDEQQIETEKTNGDINGTAADLNIPNLTVLNATEPVESSPNSQIMPNISILVASDSNISGENDQAMIPNISGLMSTEKNSNLSILMPNTTGQSDNSLRSNSSSNRTCVSPLPNLSLNTFLPHFTFNELEISTNFFDTTPHKSSPEMENSLVESNGRFLGSGAFGSVFLALGLIEKPTAVKKLHLNNVDVVNIDDTITKQFRNEVEVLCKYKHENLVSLVGYSCDGPTYCLIYEYISGGALKDKLEFAKEELLWTDRLNIALGTSRAVSYLHTAFSNPLIHRDIKSANILLDCTNKPKLCDFGLIKLTPNQNTNTMTTVIGTSAYMAPEAFRGDVSVKIDTFSFGVVLLELLTALPPLDDNRNGRDLVTHIGDCCEDDDISPFLDKKAGSWESNNVNVADRLFTIACSCLEEKKKRPTMVEVTEQLVNLFQEVS